MKKIRFAREMSVEINLKFRRKDASNLDRLLKRVREAVAKIAPNLGKEFDGHWSPGAGIVILKRDWLAATDGDFNRIGVRNAASVRNRKRGLSRRSEAEAG